LNDSKNFAFGQLNMVKLNNDQRIC